MSTETSPIFLRWRAWAFACTSFVSLLWIILLCIIAFGRWDLSDRPEKAFIVILLLTNTINLLALPILILRQFRPWLDAARLLLLLCINIGVAVAFIIWNPKFQCPEQTADQEGVCKLINIYILLANWVNPALLITYSCCLGFLVWWRSRQPQSTLATKEDFDDEEASISVGHHSTFSMAFPEMGSRRPSTFTIPITPGVSLPPKTPTHIGRPSVPPIIIPEAGRTRPLTLNLPVASNGSTTPRTPHYGKRPSMPPRSFTDNSMGQIRPSMSTIPLTPGGNTPPKTPTREWYSWERDIYPAADRKVPTGVENLRLSRPPMVTRLSKQRVPPSVLY